MIRVLVCGDRNYNDYSRLARWLSCISEQNGGFSVLIHGAAPGADSLAGEWARRNAIVERSFPAEWRRFGKAAGPIRNQRMLKEGRPDLVVAFHRDIAKSKGTAHMLKIARAAGVQTLLID